MRSQDVKVDPLDVTNVALYTDYTSAGEETDELLQYLGRRLRPKEHHVVVHSRPIWYADENNNLQPIQVDVDRTDYEDKYVFHELRNTLGFECDSKGKTTFKIGTAVALELDPLVRCSRCPKGSLLSERTDFPERQLLRVSKRNIKQHSCFGPDVHVDYHVHGGTVKEDITLEDLPKEAKSSKTFRLEWSYSSQTLVPQEYGKGLLWLDVMGRPLLRFEDPYAYDATGKKLSVEYDVNLKRQTISVVMQSEELRNAVYPVVIDPTSTTNQAACTANRSTYLDSGTHDEYYMAFMKFSLPDLTGWATITAATVQVNCTAAGGASHDTFCDVTGAWDETSNETTLEALSFNAKTDGPDAVSTTGNKTFDILGDLTKGIKKIYTDDPSPNPCTVRFVWTGTNPGTDNAETQIRIGEQNADRNSFALRTDATNYPRIAITYTIASTITVTGKSGGVLLQEIVPDGNANKKFTAVGKSGGVTLPPLRTRGLPKLSNLQGHWLGDSATKMWDASGNGRHLTIGGSGTSVVTGRYGNAVSFNGSGYFQDAGSTGGIPNTYGAGSVTVAAWFKKSSAPGSEGAIAGWVTGSKILRLSIDTSGFAKFYITDATNSATATGAVNICDNNWHHVVGVLRFGLYINLYVDGKYVASASATSVGSMTGSVAFFVGSIATATSLLAATIDEVAVWNTYLSPGEVWGLYVGFGVNELLTNGELEGTYTSGLPSGWAKTGGGGVTFTEETSGHYQGRACVKAVVPTEAFNNFFEHTTNFSVTSGVWYRVSFWLKVTSGVLHQFNIFSVANGTMKTFSNYNWKNSGWEEIVLVFQASATRTDMRIRPYNGFYTPGTWFVDAFSVVPLPNVLIRRFTAGTAPHANMPAFQADSAGHIERIADGAGITLGAETVDSATELNRFAAAAFDMPAIETGSIVNTTIKTVTGAVPLPAFTSEGDVSATRVATGDPSLSVFEVDGLAKPSRKVTGSPDLTVFDIAGQAKRIFLAGTTFGNPAMPLFSLDANGKMKRKPIGHPALPKFQVDALEKAKKKYTGNASIRAVVVDGHTVGPLVKGSMEYSLPPFEMDGLEKKWVHGDAPVTFSMPAFTASGSGVLYFDLSSEGQVSLPPMEVLGTTDHLAIVTTEGAIDLGAFTSLGSGFSRTPKSAEGAIPLPAFTMDAEATTFYVRSAEGTTLCPGFVISSSVLRSILAEAEIPLSVFEAAGLQRVLQGVDGSVALTAINVEGLIADHKIVDGTINLPPFTVLGSSGIRTWRGVGIVELAPMGAEGAATREIRTTGGIRIPIGIVEGAVYPLRVTVGICTLPSFRIYIRARLEDGTDLRWYRITNINAVRGTSLRKAKVELINRPVNRTRPVVHVGTLETSLPGMEVSGAVEF